MTSIIASNYRRVDRARHAGIVSCAWPRKLATIPKLETERVHPYYFFAERGFAEENGGRGGVEASAATAILWKLHRPFQLPPSVQPKYVTPISRLIVVILFRIRAPLHAGCFARMIVSPSLPSSPSLLTFFFVWYGVLRTMKYSRLETVISIKDCTTFCQFREVYNFIVKKR